MSNRKMLDDFHGITLDAELTPGGDNQVIGRMRSPGYDIEVTSMLVQVYYDDNLIDIGKTSGIDPVSVNIEASSQDGEAFRNSYADLFALQKYGISDSFKSFVMEKNTDFEMTFIHTEKAWSDGAKKIKFKVTFLGKKAEEK